ncbi:ATP-binding protein [Neobacillus sp. SCS-31]|uniref:ATP-binding protein n=1 Tax=Neobacillus oceani TaxID=3115292 RepID=UPI0039066F7C
MTGKLQDVRMVSEEVKALKLFFLIFYITFIGIDLLFYLLYKGPATVRMEAFKPWDFAWYYALVILLLPISLYLTKTRSPYFIKYFAFISFSLFDFAFLVYMYTHLGKGVFGGNFAEVVFLLLSPIFVNKRFYWTVSLGTVCKYAVFGLLFKNVGSFMPIVLCIVISLMSYILLNRFTSFVNALTKVYEDLNNTEKLASIGQMATGIAHEIKNPLTSLKGFVKLQQESLEGKTDYSPIMNQEIDRINSIVSDLMILGKPKNTLMNKINLKDTVEYGLAIAEQFAMGKRIEFIKDYDTKPYYINGDEGQLKQVVINLVKNSVEAVDDCGYIRIAINRTDNNRIITVVEDNGHGIPPSNIRKLFDPFFTTKFEGTGLGLMVTNQIIKDHGGEILIDSKVEEGTKISILLPEVL